MVYYSPTIRFTFFGSIAFAIASGIGLLASLRSVDRLVHFTQFQSAQQHLVLYAFYSMVMFGAIYYITPRLVGCEWLSSTLIKVHFWGSAYGGGMLIAMLLFAGIAAGFALADPEVNLRADHAAGRGLSTRKHHGVCHGRHRAPRLQPAFSSDAPAHRPAGRVEPTLFATTGRGEPPMNRSILPGRGNLRLVRPFVLCPRARAADATRAVCNHHFDEENKIDHLSGE